MTLERCLDNNDVSAASGERLEVSYVWCREDGRAEEDAGPAEGSVSSAEQAAVFDLVVPETRTYYPWARVWWEDSCGNSIIVSLQGEGEQAHEFVVQGGTLQWWHWLPVAGEAGLELKRGTYRLLVRNREDGARLSRVLFCTKRYDVYKPETPEG